MAFYRRSSTSTSSASRRGGRAFAFLGRRPSAGDPVAAEQRRVRHVQAGLHHLSFQVPDLDAVRRAESTLDRARRGARHDGIVPTARAPPPVASSSRTPTGSGWRSTPPRRRRPPQPRRRRPDLRLLLEHRSRGRAGPDPTRVAGRTANRRNRERRESRRRVDRAAPGRARTLTVGSAGSPIIPAVAADFLSRQRMLVIGRRGWTSRRLGRRSRARRASTAPRPRTQAVARARCRRDDPLADGALRGRAGGRDARHRAREPPQDAGQRGAREEGDQLVVRTDQVYANCPKYIQTRIAGRRRTPPGTADGATTRR